MTLILNGTDGLSDVDGTAATPAIRGTDANTGIFFPAADTIAFSEGGAESMRIDSAGNVGIGLTSFGERLNVYSATGTVRTLIASSANQLYVGWDGTDAIAENATNGAWRVRTGGSFTERMRIDSSGSVGIGLTTALGDANGMFIRTGTGDTYFNHITGTTSGSGYLQFIYATSLIGNITQNGTTAVAYNTTSDYRLKEDITPMTGALATVSTLKPVTYKWKIDGSDGQGFIAHELQAVMPDCVTGEKDAVDEDGNIKPQGIDTSFLVATLTAAIQELKATVDAQAARIAALEA
jgi:hypothetical protein